MSRPTHEAGQGGFAISRAGPDDVPAIKAIVNAAYTKYIERIGRPPAPMLANYGELLKTHDVFVLRTQDDNAKVIGSIILRSDDTSNSVEINNLVVGPAVQGRGYGRVLMRHAEDVAREKGRTALTLYTNAKMLENLALYPKLGFVVTERRTENGYDRVFFRKDLAGQ